MLFLKAVTYLLLGLHCWKITAGHNSCQTKSAVSEHALKGHVFSTLEGKRRESCVTTCERVQNCFSINYYASLKRCELNNKSAEWYLSDLIPTSGALYLAMVSREYTPCVDRYPPCSGTCVPIPGSLATQCNCEGNVTCHNESSCSMPLGMEDGSITDNMITVSSTHAGRQKAWGRLHRSERGWSPLTDDENQWFQVNFDPKVKYITHIATQGDGKQWWWVEEYYVMFKKGASATFETYMENNQRMNFTGNTDLKNVVTHNFGNPFQAVAVRIKPAAWNGRIALRIELYGCDNK